MIADLRFHLTLGQKCNINEVGKFIEDILWKHCKWTDLNSITETRRQIKTILKGINYGYGCKMKGEYKMCVKGCNLYTNE